MSRVRPLSPSDLRPAPAGLRLRVAGRVGSASDSVCTLVDALGQVRVHLREAAQLAPGDLVIVEGRYAEQALNDAELVERSACPEPRGDGDFARLAWRGVGSKLRSRGQALSAVRAYFATEAFLEVETPLRVPAPGVDLHLDAIPAQGGYLITSPELHMKRLLVAGLPRVFQLARASRRDELGIWHEPEFSMLEWYRAFAGLEAVIADTEQLLRAVALSVSGTTQLFGATGQAYALDLPFSRVTVREAFLEHAGIADAVDLAHSDEARYFELLVNRVEPGLARESRPLILWKYPANQAALARLSAEDSSVAERFELYVGGVELCNGFDELTDAVEQRARFELDSARRAREGRPVYPIDEPFLAALAAGMPRAGGNALGFDRLLMLATGAREIADVMAFPAQLAQS
ncbi:MAG: EF-P lysine aminoacylase EpmA [Polyangiaceae bacterium]